MTFKKADLHCHSLYSDGSCSPFELIAMAKERSLSGLSITDHDTVAAYSEAFAIAEQEGLPLLAGAEFSSEFNRIGVHILAYAIDLKSEPLLNLCQRHQQRRRQRNLLMLSALADKGIYLSEGQLLEKAGQATIGRPHIAELLVAGGHCSDMKEAFTRYLGDRAPCYRRFETVSSEETIEIIHQAGGVAVLAHPHLLPKETKIDRLLCLPFDGIEAYYGNFNSQKNRPWVELAQQHSLFVTGGSDFHGAAKSQAELGSAWTPFDLFERLRQTSHSTG